MKEASKKLQKPEKSEKDSTIAERMRVAISVLGYKRVMDFIADTGIKQSTLYAVLSDQTKDPGVSILEYFYHAGIDLNWLVTGEGEILRAGWRDIGAGETGEKRPARYPVRGEVGTIEQRIRDAMDDVIGMYQQLNAMRDYASELEKLPPEKQKMFHNMAHVFLKGMKSKEEKEGE